MKAAVVSSMVLIVGAAFGQAPADPAFEVATIKQATFPSEQFFRGFSAAGACGKTRLTIAGNRVTVSSITVCGLIRLAYDVQNYQVSGVPERLIKAEESNYFDLEARAAGETALTVDQAQAMLKTLLAERFQLKLHRETKDLPVYALVVGKSGHKLKTEAICETPPKLDPDNPMVGMTNCKPIRSMAQLAVDLTGYQGVDRPVVDRTGLTGLYAFSVRWGLENARVVPNPDIFTAVQEQLGLKLEPQKAPVEMLVIDRAERPSEN